MGLILDTSFVIAAEREARRGQTGTVDAFLARQESEILFITFTVAGELAYGRSASARRDWERLCKAYPVLPWTEATAWHYGEIYRALADRGTLIGSNDMWIAASALEHGYGVVTSNLADFERVPGLRVLPFI